MKNLDTNYVDLYQIHFPNPTIDLKKTLRTMEKMIDADNNIIAGDSKVIIDDNALYRHKDYMITDPVMPWTITLVSLFIITILFNPLYS